MLKALLINPVRFNMIKPPVPESVNDPKEAGYYPPIGLLYIASMAENVSGCSVKVLDADAEQFNYLQIEEFISKESPDIVGIQTMTYTLIDSLETARIAKKVDKNIHVCLGGPHISIYPEETLRFPQVDSVIQGEGEYVFADLLDAIIKNKDLSLVPGIIFKKNGRITSTGYRGLIEDIDSLPFPARHLVSMNKYWSILSGSSGVTTIITSRGCPFNCIFCERPHLGKKFRFRSAGNVVDELQQSYENEVRSFIFYDDTFTLNKNRVYDICDEILKRRLKIDWSIRARVDSIDKAMLAKLKSAGCRTINFGVESGNPQILKALRKDINIEQIRNAFSWSRELGIKTLAYFMIGNPTESKEQIMETIAFAKDLSPDYINVSLTTPFPGTDLYKLGMETGLFKSDYWAEFARNPVKGFSPRLWEEKLSSEELHDLLAYAYKSFYSQPRLLLRQLLSVRDPRDLVRKIKMGMRLILK